MEGRAPRPTASILRSPAIGKRTGQHDRRVMFDLDPFSIGCIEYVSDTGAVVNVDDCTNGDSDNNASVVDVVV